MSKYRMAAFAAVAFSAASLLSSVAMAGEVVWWTPNWGQPRAEKLAADFQKANPGITIKLEITTSNGLPQRILTALQSGAAPDVIEVQHPWVQGYAQSDLVLPLDDVIQDKDDYNKAAINYDTYDGKLYGIPYRIECVGVMYNLDDFKAAGLDPANPPQTWDQWADAAKKMTTGGKFGMAITGGGEVGNTITRLLPLIWMNGGNIISDDGKTAVVNSPEAVAAVKFYTDFYRNKYSPDSTLQNDGIANRQLFIAGKVSMYQTGQYDVAPIRQANAKINLGAMATPHPEGKQTAGVIGGWSFVIPKDAKNPDDAKKFLQFLNTSDNQGFFTDTFPARVSALNLPRFQDPMLKQFAAILPYGRPSPNTPHWVQISQALFDGIQRVLSGDQDPKASMDQANDEIQALLDS
ncbi:ABC-type glycerol-3-phosphate transport system substrate-binding protein [Rhizobium sp. BK313]|uniref:ABC transporter substrate-binding protein n=1 Tax=Rhizobium sp. BK313 TaxID=2587081 RepID=UPI00106055D5|nr:sugar ABC transporter substrate-binding protein [Rhizobium sp. BK313]MBB3456941.1 ABC-type glycerol-3-phosphate transport system substrate-binding protein [Rhizobium sp. BK313]